MQAFLFDSIVTVLCEIQYYPGVYTYDYTENFAHPFFPKYNAAYWEEYQKIVNLYEWEGKAGEPAKKVARIDYDYLHEFDIRQADSAAEYIKAHAKSDKPFFMDVNFMKMHNPNIPAKEIEPRSTRRQQRYISDSAPRG